jgi:hypothetical protein
MNRTSRSLASPLANRVYRHLYLAQISALTGTGVMTVGLALLAYELAGEAAGAVLGIALTLRIVAFVLISPTRTCCPDAGSWSGLTSSARRPCCCLSSMRSGRSICSSS